MDVSDILASHSANQQEIPGKDVPFDIDAGLLTVTDPNPLDVEEYNDNIEEYLQTLAQQGVQALLGTLFSLPTTSTPDGPLAQLPAVVTLLPRSKPLPKPKPPTKWERFAAAKGITKTKRERKVWDEERQEWVNRWGRDGKNKQEETQWLTEVKSNADVDFDPSKAARDARKARVSKNERQQLQNVARAQGPSVDRGQRKADIDHTLASTRASTASMGRFDRKLEGEKKMKGVKRKFDPSESSAGDEKNASLALLSKMSSDAGKMKRVRTEDGPGDTPVNVRKAIRFASKGRGGAAMARQQTDGKRRKGRS